MHPIFPGHNLQAQDQNQRKISCQIKKNLDGFKFSGSGPIGYLVSFKANMNHLNVWDCLARERVLEFLGISFDTKKIT